MKTRLRSMACPFVCGIALFSLLTGRAQESRFYARVDAGGTWMYDANFREFFGADTSGSKVKFDPGARLSFATGYQVTDWFSAELETGFMANRIDEITGAYTDDASLANVPFLLNARFQLPNRSRLTPYIGGGLGGSATVIDADFIKFGGISLQGSQSALVFAYQCFGGLRFKLNETMGLSLEYHYFATTEPTWEAEFTAGTASNQMGFGSIETHAVSLAFDWKF